MTVICALFDAASDTTWIGSDTRVTACHQAFDFGPKWVTAPGWAVGCAGDLRTINVLSAHAAALFERLKDPFAFTQRLRRVFAAEGIHAVCPNEGEEGGAETFGQDFILASPGNVWVLDSSLSIFKAPPNDPAAEGSGAAYALGAGFVLRARETPPADILKHMIETAMAFDSHCGGRAWVRRLTG